MLMDRNNIEKIGKTQEEKLLLAKLWDKIDAGMRRNVPASTCFLSPYEQSLAQFLFGQAEGLHAFGGYEDAERKMLVYLPDYLEEKALYEEQSPVVCLQAQFYHGDSPGHRDFLGALIGSGISRENIGDICVGEGKCIFFVTQAVAPFLLDSFTQAGRTRVHLSQLPLEGVAVPEPEIKEIRDTVASLRLDSIVSSGFRISRGIAADCIAASRVCINGVVCEKPDKPVPENAKISVRGYGKIRLAGIGGETKKGRISITIHQYV